MWDIQRMWDLTIHPPSRPSVLTGTSSPLKLMWDLTINPLWGLVSSFALVPLSNRCEISQSTPLRDSSSLLALVLLSNWYGISQSTPFRVSVLATAGFSLQSMWDPTIHPSLELNVLAGIPPSVLLWYHL